MKNMKMSTTLTIANTLVVTVCILLLYIIANKSMLRMMKIYWFLSARHQRLLSC